MEDLISRKALLDELENKYSKYETIIEITGDNSTKDIIDKTLKAYRKMLKGMILEQPAAYNVDKVVEQLEDYGKYKGILMITENVSDCDNYIPVREVKKIVKAGGINE